MLSYRGSVSHDIIKSLLVLAEKKMEIDGTIISTKKKVFNIMFECLQNISKHTDVSHKRQDGLFLIGKKENQYFIFSGNLVLNSKIDDLSSKLTKVNELNKEELSQLYKKLMIENKEADDNNAGMGIIDIARKSGNKLEFKFFQVNETQSYFTLKTTINSNPEIA